MNSATSRRLVSTRTAETTPLGTAGQRSYELIRREVATLSPKAAALFAEPFVTPEGDAVDWYGEGSGTATRLDATPEPQRSDARTTLDHLVAAVTKRADALLEDRDEERRRLGEALRNAVEIPGEDCIYVIGSQPVLVCWAHRSNAARPRIGVLTQRLAAAPRPAPAQAMAAHAVPEPAATIAVGAPIGQTAHRRGTLGWLWWLLWALVGLLAIVIAWLLLPACGITTISWLNRCPVPVVSAALPETDRSAALSAELETLQRQLRDADQTCRPERQVLQCPPLRPHETTLLLDASSSMDFGMGTDPQLDRDIFELSRKADHSGHFANSEDRRQYQELVRRALATPGDKRIDVAKRALIRALEHADFPPMRLSTFNMCGKKNVQGPFPNAEAARTAIERVRTGSNTALAEAITHAAENLDGGQTAESPASIVLVSDGYDTCGGDPCAAARAAKAARPGLRIDVIDLVGLPQLQCVADLTGGTYQIAPRNADPETLAGLIAKSAGVPAPPGCDPSEDHAALSPENNDFNERVAREQGAADGPLQVTLIWENESDLDLALHCPGGKKISYRYKSACGGVLDIDQNLTSNVVRTPVENISFAASPATGNYRVVVRNYKQRGAGPTSFKLRIVKSGDIRIEQGRLTRSGENTEFSFNYP